jgi:hypothetical protein
MAHPEALSYAGGVLGAVMIREPVAASRVGTPPGKYGYSLSEATHRSDNNDLIVNRCLGRTQLVDQFPL